MYPITVWNAVLENENDQDPFLTAPFHQSYKAGNFTRVPILYGFDSEEILMCVKGKLKLYIINICKQTFLDFINHVIISALLHFVGCSSDVIAILYFYLNDICQYVKTKIV